jgi:hypothetical protein
VKTADPAKTGDELRFPFDMRLTFRQEAPDQSPHCDYNSGECRQYVAGYFKRDRGTGVLKSDNQWLPGNRLMQPHPDCQEDGIPLPRGKGRLPIRQEVYGHRYRTDQECMILKPAARPFLATNNENDHFLDPDREDGCTYESHDKPGIDAYPNEEVHFHFWFGGGPVDACNGRVAIGEWEEWQGVADRVPPKPSPRKPKPPKPNRTTPRPYTGPLSGSSRFFHYAGGIDLAPTFGEVKICTRSWIVTRANTGVVTKGFELGIKRSTACEAAFATNQKSCVAGRCSCCRQTSWSSSKRAVTRWCIATVS